MIVNLTELSRATGHTCETLRKIMRRNRGFPIIRAGSRGVACEFDLEAVQEFLATMAQARRASADQRRRTIEDLGLTAIAAREGMEAGR